MQQCYFIQVCNPSSYLITQHTIEIYDTLPQFSRGYYDIDHRPRKKVKIDAQAVSWRSCRVDRRDRSMNGGSGESGFWSLDMFGEEEEGFKLFSIVTRVDESRRFSTIYRIHERTSQPN